MQELTPAYLNGAWHLDDTTGPRPICQNRLPVTALNPGWHAESAYRLTESLIILGIRHDDGRMAAWFLNETYEYITNNASELAPGLNAYLIGMAELALTWTALQQISASSARTDESRRVIGDIFVGFVQEPCSHSAIVMPYP